MSDFSLYSIGLILARHNRDDVFARFLRDTLVEAGVRLHRLPVESLPGLVELGRKQGLDFDDAYQYAVCRAYELELVSFDDDFDSTPEGRLDPVDVPL